METENNQLTLCGVIESEPVLDHEVFGEHFYRMDLKVPRLSGAQDLLPVTVSEEFLSELFASIATDPAARVRVDVPAQTVTNLATGRSERFELNAYKKYCLTHALDDIDYLLEQKDKIEAFERARA